MGEYLFTYCPMIIYVFTQNIYNNNFVKYTIYPAPYPPSQYPPLTCALSFYIINTPLSALSVYIHPQVAHICSYELVNYMLNKRSEHLSYFFQQTLLGKMERFIPIGYIYCIYIYIYREI